MDAKEVFQKKVESQVTRWKRKIDELRTKVDAAEASAKLKLRDQMDSLHERREKAEKLLEDLKGFGGDAWENVKSGAEHAWGELSRTAKKTITKVRNAITHPNRDEEIRMIAYYIWLDEGCPAGRHQEHWIKAEAIWQERQANQPAAVKAKSTAKKSRAVKKTTVRRTRGKKEDAPSQGDQS